MLTGTIVPASVYTEYNDPEKRLKDYIVAIRFYCKTLPNDDVFFLENSNFDLENSKEFQQLRSECRFQTLRFPPSDKYYEGKGYQEFEMLDKAFVELEPRYKVLVKITGRYIIRNIAEILNEPCQGMLIDLNKRYHAAETFLLVYTREFYRENILGLFKQVNDNEGVFIEKVIYRCLLDKQLLSQTKLFPLTTDLEGVTGSYGISLRRNYFKMRIRNFERKIYRTLGIKQFFY